MSKCSCKNHIIKKANLKSTQLSFYYNDSDRTRLAPFDIKYKGQPAWKCDSCGKPVLDSLGKPVQSKKQIDNENLDTNISHDYYDERIEVNNSPRSLINEKYLEEPTKEYLTKAFNEFVNIFESSLKDLLLKFDELRIKYKDSNEDNDLQMFDGAEDYVDMAIKIFKQNILSTVLISENILNNFIFEPEIVWRSFSLDRSIQQLSNRYYYITLRKDNKYIYNYFSKYIEDIKFLLKNGFEFASRQDNIISEIVLTKPKCIECSFHNYTCVLCGESGSDSSDFVQVPYNKLDVSNDQLEFGKSFDKEKAIVCKNCGDICANCREFIDLTVRYPDVKEHDNEKYHEDCFHELFGFCEDCGDFYDLDKLSPAPEPFNNRDRNLYCEYHFKQHYAQCNECDTWINAEDVNEDGTCNDCYLEQSDNEVSYEFQSEVNSHLRSIQNDRFFPLDEKVITGTIIPVLDSAIKKSKNKQWNESFKNEIISKINSKEGKAAINSLWEEYEPETGTVENSLIDLKNFFERNKNYIVSFKQKYPQLKGYKPLPVKSSLEDGAGHPGKVIAIYPTHNLLVYLDSLYPGAKEFYDNNLKNTGHHSGALAYMRFTESNNSIVIDNLQTDIDIQFISRRYFQYIFNSKLNFLNKNYQKLINDNSYTFNTYDFHQEFYDDDNLDDFVNKVYGKRNYLLKKINESNIDPELKEKLINLNHDYSESIIKIFEEKLSMKIPDYVKVWGTIGKGFWAPYLLDMIREIGKEADKKVYLTTFEMQQDKWSAIPDRNVDIYNKTPMSMGLSLEEAELQPEDLSSDTYNLFRLAKKYLNYSR